MIDGKSVLALIPARGGSKSLPGKNIANCGGRPLIAWTIAAAKESKYVDLLVTSTDNDEIANVAKVNGCSTVIARPSELAADDTRMEEVISHAINNSEYDICVLLQPTSPLRTAADIDGALELLINRDSVVSVYESHSVPFTGEDPPRRQERKPAMFLNGAVYAFRTEWFKRTRLCVAKDSIPYVMPQERSIDVDYPFQLAIAALMIGTL